MRKNPLPPTPRKRRAKSLFVRRLVIAEADLHPTQRKLASFSIKRGMREGMEHSHPYKSDGRHP